MVIKFRQNPSGSIKLLYDLRRCGRIMSCRGCVYLVTKILYNYLITLSCIIVAVSCCCCCCWCKL